ncbi:hypothetical protein Hanom_Chr10g00950041 [Helianthus anomalus]
MSDDDTEVYSKYSTRYEYTHSGSRRRDHREEQYSQKRQSVHSRLGPRFSQKRDTQTDEYDRTYYKDDNTSVFNQIQKYHASHKPKTRAVYNPEAEYDYNLIYRPAEAAENSKFVREIALAPSSGQNYLQM